MADYMDPFNEKTFYSLFEPWVTIINQKESGSVLHIPRRDQLYHVHQFLSSAPFLKTRLLEYRELQFIVLDLNTVVLDDVSDLKAYLDSKILKNKRPVLLILDADTLLEDKRHLLAYLDAQHQEFCATLIYFFSKNITYDKYSRLLNSFTSLFQHIVILPYFDKQDSKDFLLNRSKQFCPVPRKISGEILNKCGGCLWLIKQCLRHYCGTKDEKVLFSHDVLNLKLRVLFTELEPDEVGVLKQIVYKNYQFSSDQLPFISYLLETKTVIKTRKHFKIAIPLFESYIKGYFAEKSRLYLDKDGLLKLNGVPVELFFSKNEKRLLNNLVSDPNRVFSRDETARLLWGSKYKESYTDWALDQMIWRLRKKLNKLNIDSNVIHTIKNKGFVFNTEYGK